MSDKKLGLYALTLAEAMAHLVSAADLPEAAKRIVRANCTLAEELDELERKYETLEKHVSHQAPKPTHELDDLVALVELSADRRKPLDHAELTGAKLALQSLAESVVEILSANDHDITTALSEAHQKITALADEGLIQIGEREEPEPIHPRLVEMIDGRPSKISA